MNDKIDAESIGRIAIEISDRYRQIIAIFPKSNEVVLKNLAASSIHMGLFMKDLYEVLEGEKMNVDKSLEATFLEKCGCKDFLKNV